MPTLNAWEKETQIFVCGVPNGMRDGSVMYMLDQKSPRYKKYRIPATENPFWEQWMHIDAIKQYGGEESDDFQRLVLGRHGDATYAVIPRDKIQMEPYEFYSYRYNQSDKAKGKHYSEVMSLPNVDKGVDTLVLAIDTGYTDPTVIQLIGVVKGSWRTLARWRLTRVAFPEQAEIIDWIDSRYNTNLIGIDLGSGGGGIGIMQDLCSSRFSKQKQYEQKIAGANFAVNVDRQDGMGAFIAKVNAKSAAGEELARMISDGDLIFSEIDAEAVSQLERVAYTKRPDGSNLYFVLSERGTGKAQDDHIFASYLVFIMTLGNLTSKRRNKKLVRPKWI